jgi:hypothetical protein
VYSKQQQQQHKLFGSHSQIIPSKRKETKMQTTFSLLYKELADYIAKLQPQDWCLPVALGRARHVSHSSVTSLPQYYPSSNSMEQNYASVQCDINGGAPSKAFPVLG